ncbi:MAG: type VI secretion system protein TssA [Rhodospirillales bacterium]|nr:type VI secretion system protein TssA [Rhodospirillales bacterium]
MAEEPEGIDVAALLLPIAGDAPAGMDLREDFSPQSVYYRLRDARAEARAAERSADENPEMETTPPPQWRTVRDLVLSALAGKAKDLELAAWLTEALVRSDGLAGLSAGARVIAGLADAFWDQNLYPVPDEDGIATRVAPVTGLNGEGSDGTLIQPLRKLVLFSRADGTNVPFWQYEQSAELQGIGDAARVKQRLAAGVVPFADMETAARAAGAARFAALRALARGALREWTVMGEILDSKAGTDGPPTSRVRDLLKQILDVAQRYAPPEAAEEAPADAGVAEDGAGEGHASGAGGSPAKAAVTREDMLGELARIAEFFRRTEPQSPLAYTLEEAIRRGRMTWPELLAEVVSDTNVRASVLSQLGIRPQEEKAG